MPSDITWQNLKRCSRWKSRIKYASVGQNRLHVAMVDNCHVFSLYEIIWFGGQQGWQSGEPVQLMMSQLQSGGEKWGVIIRLNVRGKAGSQTWSGIVHLIMMGNSPFVWNFAPEQSTLHLVSADCAVLGMRWCVWFIKDATNMLHYPWYKGNCFQHGKSFWALTLLWLQSDRVRLKCPNEEIVFIRTFSLRFYLCVWHDPLFWGFSSGIYRNRNCLFLHLCCLTKMISHAFFMNIIHPRIK